MVEITISGAPGSGTSTLVRRICAEMGWRSLNGGDVFRAEAERRDLSVHDFSELCKNDLDVDRSLDFRLKQAMTDSAGPEVLESRLSGLLFDRAERHRFGAVLWWCLDVFLQVKFIISRPIQVR